MMEKTVLLKRTAAVLFCLLGISMDVSQANEFRRCKVDCLKESFACTEAAEESFESVSCLITKYKCKERCYKEHITFLKLKLVTTKSSNMEGSGR